MQGSMHHEILLALSGYPGNSFILSKDSGLIEVTVIVKQAVMYGWHNVSRWTQRFPSYIPVKSAC